MCLAVFTSIYIFFQFLIIRPASASQLDQWTHQSDVYGRQPISEAAVSDGFAADDAVRDGRESGERFKEEQTPHCAEEVSEQISFHCNLCKKNLGSVTQYGIPCYPHRPIALPSCVIMPKAFSKTGNYCCSAERRMLSWRDSMPTQ